MKTDKSEDVVKQLLSIAEIEINGRYPWILKYIIRNFIRGTISRFAGSGRVFHGWLVGLWAPGWVFLPTPQIWSRKQSKKEPGSAFSGVIIQTIQHAIQIKGFPNRREALRLGNELFKKMLDSRMVYSCAYWRNAKTLNEAQENKLELICRNWIAIWMKILDIGCGWEVY